MLSPCSDLRVKRTQNIRPRYFRQRGGEGGKWPCSEPVYTCLQSEQRGHAVAVFLVHVMENADVGSTRALAAFAVHGGSFRSEYILSEAPWLVREMLRCVWDVHQKNFF